MSPKKGTPINGSGTPKRKGEVRHENGSFAKGTCGGPGRHKAHRGELLQRILNEKIDAKTAEKIVAKWLSLASKGHPWAVKEFLDRCLGKADQKIDVGDNTLALVESVREGLRAIMARPEVANRLEDEVLRR